jgi:hypothetical protein
MSIIMSVLIVAHGTDAAALHAARAQLGHISCTVPIGSRNR